MRKKILYICNHASFFVSHRINLINYAHSQNYEVKLLIGQAASDIMEKNAVKILKKNKINFHRCLFTSSSKNILFDLIGLFQIFFLIIKFRPNIVHSISPKANLLTIISIFFYKLDSLIISISGMGYLYTGNYGLYKNFLKKINEKIYRLFFYFKKNYKVIVQNLDDKIEFTRIYPNTKNNIILIPSSGIELNDNKFNSHIKEKWIILPSRLLFSKGIKEFVESSKILKSRHKDWKFILIGSSDYVSPDSISKDLIKKWEINKYIEYWGYIENINEIYKKASIVCLPSYREGFPKTVLEASLNYCAVVTTNVTGCKDSIINRETGILVNANDINSLCEAIETLINDKNLRKKYGINGNKFVKKNFSLEKITRQIFEIYNI